MTLRLPVLALCLALAAPHAIAGAAPVIVCSTTLVGDVVRALAGPALEVNVLLPPGTDPHALQPTPADALALEAADLVVLSGAGLETSLAPLLASVRGRTVDLSSEIALRADDEHGVDPHVWLDPWNVLAWTRTLVDALCALDPEGCDATRARAAAYEAELVALDAWIRERVATLPEASRQLATDHASFGYFAARYGFVEIGSVFPGASTLTEPSARDLARFEDALRAAGVRALFVGTTVSPALAEQVARDTGVRIVFLYTGSLSEPGGPADSYLRMMQTNVDQIVSALMPTP